ncbi:MAG: hypothetical protein R6V56_02155 [Lentisphaeria bacterium]
MLKSLAAAWQQIWGYSLPLKSEQEGEPDPVLFVRLLPLAGLALGVVLWLTAWLSIILIGNYLAGAVVAAILVPLLYNWLSGGRGLVTASRLGAQLTDGRLVVSPELQALVAVQICLILQAIAVLILVLTSQSWWLLLMPVLGSTAYAELLSSRDENGVSADRLGPVHWYIAGALVLLVTGLQGQLIAGLFALVLAWLMAPAVNRFLANRGVEDDADRMRGAFYIAEGLILWVGVLAA